MTSTSVFEISRQDVQKLEIPALASITNVKHLSSYNWIEADNSTPTIAVPGSPARWSPPAAPRRLNKDSGLIYIAQNAARHPQSPLEPLFRALYVTNPAFDIRSTDVVTDRNNIRKLLSFINPGSTRNGLEPFTMNIETTKNTAIFCRDEAKITEYLGPHEFRGFGHEFEKAYTTAEVDGSTGHHRIISYRFGDLNFIVRHETDGYVDTHTRTSSSNVKTVTQDDLSNLLGTLSLSSAQTSPSITCAGSKLMIKEDGQPVPLESTLEIKTRVSHKPLDFEEVAPQLWASQTPKLVRAYHRNGTFQRPVVEDVTAVTKIWEERKQSDLRRLAALIRKIVNHVKECGGNAVLKYNVEGDKLVVSKAERKAMLPKDLYSKWDDEQKHPVNTDTRNDSVLATGTTEVGQQSIPAMRSGKAHPKTTIRIGTVDYSVHVSKIPYLASFIQVQKATSPETTEFVHDPIPLFDVALKGVESGFRQCFRSLPTELYQYRTLFTTYAFLKIDILCGLPMDAVIANLKVCRADYDPEERRQIRGNKSLARDTAFQLLYLILYGQLEDEKKDSMKLFNAVVFVVSHPGTFKYRTKRVIRAAYEDRFSPTIKQVVGLNKWEKGEVGKDATDATTEEEPEYYFDSDDYSS